MFTVPRTASIGIRVEPTLKAEVEKLAKEDGRTVAQWIERLIVRELHAVKTQQPKRAASR
jgi:predicted HicB family RNase H-like nuclease